MSRNPTLRNITLSSEDSDWFSGRIFPCPVCGNGLAVGLTIKNKPYCTCNDCGLQVFFRGKAGIERLRQLFAKDKFISYENSAAGDPLALINNLEKLKIQKRDLESKRGFIFENQAVADAIQVVEGEIAGIEKELSKRAAKTGRKK